MSNKDKDRLGSFITLEIFKYNIEILQIECGQRGFLFWFITNDNVRVFGYWKDEKKLSFKKWQNDHCYCG